MKVIKTVCHRDCPDTCFLDVTVENGKILSVRGSRENPVTRGFVCPRGRGDPKKGLQQAAGPLSAREKTGEFY